MRLPSRRVTDDRELEVETGITPADHRFATPESIRRQERALLGPAWGKKRRPYKAKG